MKTRRNIFGIAALLVVALLFGIVGGTSFAIAEKGFADINSFQGETVEELIASAVISQGAKDMLLQAVKEKEQSKNEFSTPEMETQYNKNNKKYTSIAAMRNDISDLLSKIVEQKAKTDWEMENPQYYRKIDSGKNKVKIEREEKIKKEKGCVFSKSQSQRFEKITCSGKLAQTEIKEMGLSKQSFYYTQDIKANFQVRATQDQMRAIVGIRKPGLTGNGTRIAFPDTGFNPFHADLQGIVVDQYNFVDNNNFPIAINFHGPFIIGEVASQGVKDPDSIGIAPGAKILAYKVIGEFGGLSTDVADAMHRAKENGATVISLSLGTVQAYNRGCDSVDPILAEEINESVQRGVNVIIASGNFNWLFPGKMSSPACMTNSFAVGASDFNDKVAYFSGRTPDVVAPGVGIRSTGPYHAEYSQYIHMDGTSMAAPLVSGVDALMTEANPKLPAYFKKLIIMISADDIDQPGWDKNSGYGRINASRAIKFAIMLKTLGQR